MFPRQHRRLSAARSAVSTEPGGLGFTLGRGWGQWMLGAGVLVMAVATGWAGARAGSWCLVSLLGLAGIARLVLPARWVPALVNRGRTFDTVVFGVLAAMVAAMIASGARL